MNGPYSFYLLDSPLVRTAPASDSLITSVSSCTMTFPIGIINQPYVARVPEVPEPPKKKEIEVADFPTGLRRRIVLE